MTLYPVISSTETLGRHQTAHVLFRATEGVFLSQVVGFLWFECFGQCSYHLVERLWLISRELNSSPNDVTIWIIYLLPHLQNYMMEI